MKASHYHLFFVIGFFLNFSLFTSGFSKDSHLPVLEDWCTKPPRPGLEKLREIKTDRSWFKVYDVGQNTYAIIEPYNWEETISYLIIGKNKALLFDTGMGLDTISLVVKQLTRLPVVVLNSHTHPDHIGGNKEFALILAMDTRYTHDNAVNGYGHHDVQWEVSPGSFCLNRLPQADTAHYDIKPFKVSQYIKSDYVIDLGGRKLKVIAAPGHTPDAICLYDKRAGYLWCGDSFYEGPILLTSEKTDLRAYQKSMNHMAQLAARSSRVLPAHNLPVSKPELLINAAKEFNQIMSGKRKGKPGEGHTLTFNCDKFSYEIGERFLQELAQ